MPAPSASSRSAALAFVSAAGALAILATYNAHYPIRQWLLWRVLGYWALTLYWAGGCMSLGVLLVGKIAPRQYRPLERVVLGFSLGVLAFSVAVLVTGVAGGLGRTFFVVAPGVFFAAGYREFARLVSRARPALRARVVTLSTLEVASLVLGGTLLVAMYVSILTPHNVQHDALWYHLPIAQQYVALGAIRRFPEGWLFGTYPHLASHLYTWAFLLPAGIVHRMLLCAHLEFVIFLVTIAAVAPLVRRVLPRTRLPLAWVSVFLFPGVLVYDSNLSTGADHVAGLFAAAGMIALIAALRTLAVGHSVLVGVAAAGALSTKYSAISVAAPLLAFVGARSLLHAQTTGRNRRAGLALAAVVASFVIAWAPHWLPNYLWYGDPVYPMLRNRLHHLHPWDAQASMYFRVFMEYAVLKPSHDLQGAFETLLAAATLGFRAYEPGFHRGMPVFGFLFAATLYCLPFTRPSWRSVVVHGLGFAAATVWYWTNHRDRYLQACLPWYVVATFCVLVTLWRSPRAISRASAAILVAAQLACGAGSYLAPSHFMIPEGHPLPQVVNLIGAGIAGRYEERFEPFKEWRFADWTALGNMLPGDARVLVHEDRLWVGLDRPVIVDEAQWQAGIRYGNLTTPAELYDLLRSFGVTHIVTGESHSDSGDHGLTGNLLFWEFLVSYSKRITTKGTLTLWKMPGARPPASTPGPTLILTCNQSQPPGLFEFQNLRAREALVPLKDKSVVPQSVADRAQYVIVEDGCGFSVEGLEAFEEMTTRRAVTYYRRGSETGEAANKRAGERER